MSAAVLQNMLTDRHLEIGRLIAQGYSNKQIAKALGITEITVRNHLAEIPVRQSPSART